ncbi:MAG: hypothetical protein ACR2HI_00535 [Gaiella sp.]
MISEIAEELLDLEVTTKGYGGALYAYVEDGGGGGNCSCCNLCVVLCCCFNW